MFDRTRSVVVVLSLSLVLGVAMSGMRAKAEGAAGATGAGDLSKDEIAKLVAQAASGEGFQPLFKADLSDAIFTSGAWAVQDGVLAATGKAKGDIWTKNKYGDFVLDLEFKCAEKTNSGVFLRCADIKQWLHTSIEIQILQQGDAKSAPTKNSCGSVYDCLAPAKQMGKPVGEWNHYTIICKASKICVILNGEQVIDMDLDKWTEAHKNPDGTKNKFNNAYKDMARAGFAGLQYHGSPIWFRNMKIKPLNG